MRSPAAKIAKAPVPPCPLQHETAMAVSTGYIFKNFAAIKAVATIATTVTMIVTIVAGFLNTSISSNQSVFATPTPKSKGGVIPRTVNPYNEFPPSSIFLGIKPSILAPISETNKITGEGIEKPRSDFNKCST